MKYCFYYIDDLLGQERCTEIMGVLEYCGLYEQVEIKSIRPLGKVDINKKNIFFFIGWKVHPIKTLLSYKEEIEWCNKNDVDVIYDFSMESINHIVQMEYCDVTPNKFKILCNPVYESVDSKWLPYIEGFDFFPPNSALMDGMVYKEDEYHVSRPPEDIKRKYFFSMFMGNVVRKQRAFTLSGLMSEGLLDNSFYSTFISRGTPNNRYTEDQISPNWLLTLDDINEFKYGDFLKNNINKITIDKFFDKPDYDNIDHFLMWNLYRIPIQMYQSYFNIVIETLQPGSFTFFTEKTYKPIIAEKPFIILGSNNQNKVLESNGYEIFEEIFDYSFESLDLIGQIETFIKEIKRVENEPRSIFDQPSVVEKIRHNKNRYIEVSSKEYTKENLVRILS